MIGDALKEESKRTLLTVLIPGTVATFPLYLKALLLLVEHDVLVKSLLVFATIGLLLSLTVGLVLENLGSMIETRLSKLYIHKLESSKSEPMEEEKLIKENKEVVMTFYDYNKIWLAYLQQSVSKDSPRVIFKYYSSLVTRFKFELHMIPAIPLMILGIYLLEKTVHIDAHLPHFYSVFYILSILALAMMMRFAYQSIGYLHEMRFEILRSSK